MNGETSLNVFRIGEACDLYMFLLKLYKFLGTHFTVPHACLKLLEIFDLEASLLKTGLL
jgi:hypothetical protein